jgi:GT2 family glycosyltransferase
VVLTQGRRPRELRRAVESLLNQRAVDVDVAVVGNGWTPEGLPDGVHAVALDEDAGIPAGRNAGVPKVTGDLLFFLDDDAVLHPGAIEHAVAALSGAPDTAAVALRVIDPQTRRTGYWIWPLEPAEWDARRFDVPNIVGCGALVRRDVFEQLGGFWTGYFREMEEVDFSWRLLDAGWRIRYEPAAVVEHPERENRRLYRFAVPGTVAMGWRLLPPGLALRQAGIKLPLFALRALRHGELREFAEGLAATPAAVRRAQRDPARLRAGTVAHLRRLHARGSWGRRLQWSLRRLGLPDLHAS